MNDWNIDVTVETEEEPPDLLQLVGIALHMVWALFWLLVFGAFLIYALSL